MTYRSFHFTAAARLDLLQIWNYLAEHATLNDADRVLANLERAILRLSKSPELGHARADLTSLDLLFYRVHSYLIVYRAIDPLHVIRVLHAARDVKTLLDG
jgi:plasmid stabilization system protein ParE